MKRNYLLLSLFIIGSLSILILILPILPVQTIHFKKNNFIHTTTLTEISAEFIKKNALNVYVFQTLKTKLLTLPQLTSVSIDYMFPSTLTVTCIEKKPWIMCMSDGKSIILADDGTILSKEQDYTLNTTQQLFVVKGIHSDSFANSSVSTSLLTQLSSLKTQLTSLLPQLPILCELRNENDWTLLLDDHIIVDIGTLDYLKDKCEQLAHFLKNIHKDKQKNIHYIDLRVKQKLLVTYEN